MRNLPRSIGVSQRARMLRSHCSPQADSSVHFAPASRKAAQRVLLRWGEADRSRRPPVCFGSFGIRACEQDEQSQAPLAGSIQPSSSQRASKASGPSIKSAALGRALDIAIDARQLVVVNQSPVPACASSAAARWLMSSRPASESATICSHSAATTFGFEQRSIDHPRASRQSVQVRLTQASSGRMSGVSQTDLPAKARVLGFAAQVARSPGIGGERRSRPASAE